LKYKLEHPEKAEGDNMKFQETDGDSFEEMHSLNQALSFDALIQEFKTRKIPFAEAQILQVLSRQKEITRKEVQELLEVSQSTAGRILKTMVDRGQIIKLGGSLTTRYRAVL